MFLSIVGPTVDGSLARWFAGSMDRWFDGLDGCVESSIDRWFVGSMVRWFGGYVSVDPTNHRTNDP